MASENEVLRSRLEEQSELIMLLKRRAEKAEGQLETATSNQQGAQTSSNRASQQSISLEAQLKQLQNQFQTLSSNHEKLILFKDEYKQQNSHLRAENKDLAGKIQAQDIRTAAAVLEAVKETKDMLATTKAAESELHQALALAQADINDLKRELQAERTQHTAVRIAQESQQQQSQAELASTRKALETQIVKIQSQFDQLQQQHTTSQASAMRLKDDLEAARKQSEVRR
jgi:chromosome segregation ATPase